MNVQKTVKDNIFYRIVSKYLGRIIDSHLILTLRADLWTLGMYF